MKMFEKLRFKCMSNKKLYEHAIGNCKLKRISLFSKYKYNYYFFPNINAQKELSKRNNIIV